MSRQELDGLFRRSPAGPIPDGRVRGVAVVASGSRYGKTLAEVIKHVGW